MFVTNAGDLVIMMARSIKIGGGPSNLLEAMAVVRECREKSRFYEVVFKIIGKGRHSGEQTK